MLTTCDQQESVLLDPYDFPEGYVEMQHPEDYIPTRTPVTPTFVFNNRCGRARLILRVSFKTDDNWFIPMSFIVDTGGTEPFYFSKKAKATLDAHGLLLLDDLQTDCVRVHLRDGPVMMVHYVDQVERYEPTNLIGLRLISRLGLVVSGKSFSFQEKFDFF